MNLDAALQTFIAESRELLADMENALLTIEHSADRGEAVNAIFRATHTIKGSAGLFGLDHVVAFTHVVESVLDEVRDGRLEIADELIVLLLSCCDHLADLNDRLEGGQIEADEDTERNGRPLLAQLGRYLDAPAGPGTAVSVAPEPLAQVERIERRGDGDAGDL